MEVIKLRPYRAQHASLGQMSPLALASVVLAQVVGTSVVDVGCGAGLYGFLLRTSTPVERIIGIDFSSVAVAALRELGVYEEVIHATSCTLPLPDKCVDTALSTETLEHLYPQDVPSALGELVRVARYQVVISTPAPWDVVNWPFLTNEIGAAETDETEMGYQEFTILSSYLHRSTLMPNQMAAAGFYFARNRFGGPAAQVGSMIYKGDPATINLSALGPVLGTSGQPAVDDGRSDWREEYVSVLRECRALPISRTPPLKVRLGNASGAWRWAIRSSGHIIPKWR